MYEDDDVVEEKTFLEKIEKDGFSLVNGKYLFTIRGAAFWIQRGTPDSSGKLSKIIEDIERHVKNRVVRQVSHESFGRLSFGVYDEVAFLTEEDIRILVEKEFPTTALCDLHSFAILFGLEFGNSEEEVISESYTSGKREVGGRAKDFVEVALQAYEKNFKCKPVKLSQLLNFAKGEGSPVNGYSITVDGSSNDKKVHFGVGNGSVTYRAVSKAFSELIK